MGNKKAHVGKRVLEYNHSAELKMYIYHSTSHRSLRKTRIKAGFLAYRSSYSPILPNFSVDLWISSLITVAGAAEAFTSFPLSLWLSTFIRIQL